MNREIIILIALAAVNVITFVLYGVDKWLAIKGRWRVPERTLLLWSAFGGGVGALLAMRVAHHKSQKMKFRLLVPLFLLLQVALVGVYLFFAPPSDFF